MSEDKLEELETKIESVIVYQTGVQITQVGKINLGTGEQTILIPDLPESLDKESVRVKGVGRAKILNINVEFTSRKEYKNQEHETLAIELEKVRKQIDKAENRISRTNEQISKYKNTEDSFYADWAKAYAYGEVQLDNFMGFNQIINEKISEKNNLIENLEDDKKRLNKELQVINNKISNLGPIEEIHNYYLIKIDLDVRSEGEFQIELKYTMKGAYWFPYYDVVLDESKARLTMIANVFNKTGVDWEGINIEISTASLKPIKLIKPDPMILQEYSLNFYAGKKTKDIKQKPGIGRMPSKPVRMEDRGDYDKFGGGDFEMADEKPSLEQSYADVSENLGVQSFKIPNKVDLPSDENPHPINLTSLELETKKKYFWSVIAPNQVIIRDSLINDDLLLLPGRVNIYLMEEFLGETNIQTVAPKEKFKLGTRISYDLKIEKKLIDRSKAKKAVKGNKRNNYQYKITIKNLNNVSEKLTVLDRIPHSSSEKIKVEIENINPDPSKKELGILKWNVTNLEGKEEMVINYTYYIEYKKDIVITPSLP